MGYCWSIQYLDSILENRDSDLFIAFPGTIGKVWLREKKHAGKTENNNNNNNKR